MGRLRLGVHVSWPLEANFLAAREVIAGVKVIGMADSVEAVVPQGTAEEEPQTSPDTTVRCRACGHEVTQRSKAIEVDGRHEHTFRNPAGYSFHVLCYADAPGSVRVGPSTSEASWFVGYDWSYAICQQCQAHLGWWYAGRKKDGDAFVGLIATRLVRAG